MRTRRSALTDLILPCLSQGAARKLKKDWDAQKKLHDKFLEKSN